MFDVCICVCACVSVDMSVSTSRCQPAHGGSDTTLNCLVKWLMVAPPPDSNHVAEIRCMGLGGPCFGLTSRQQG